MTTLPQTITTRISRPQGLAQAGAVGGVPAMAALNAGLSGADVRRVIRSNLWMILAVMVVSIGLGYVVNRFLQSHYPRYEAVGYVEIQSNAPAGVLRSAQPQGGQEQMNLNVEQKTNAKLLESDALLSTVLQKQGGELRNTSWFRSFSTVEDAKEAFFSAFSVTPVPDTKLVMVSFTSSNADEARRIVQEMVDTYILQQQIIANNVLSDKSVQLNNLKIKYEMRENDLAKQLRDLSSRLSSNGGDASRSGIMEVELSTLLQQERTLAGNVAEYQADLDAVKKSLETGVDPPTVVRIIRDNPDLRSLKSQVVGADLQLQQMIIQYGEQNRRVKDQQAVLEMVKRKYAEQEAEARADAREQLQDDLTQQIALSLKAQKDLAGRIEEAEAAVGEMSNLQSEYLVKQDEDKALREAIKDISDQLEAIGDRTGSSVHVEWMQPPTKPDVMKFPKLYITMSISVMLGLALSLGIAFLREAMDTTVRSPRDIARIGQINLLGTVTDEADDPQAAGARLPLMIFDAPHSMIAEQLRQVRTQLQHAASLDTTRSIMVTSPGPGDGKTTIACNLGAGLALNGRRILLVDANFRRPELHRIFGVANEQGFSDVLGGSLAFEQVVQETQVPNLSLMTSGPQVINATEMFESQLLIDFIERALEEFDHVIFDSGPIMVVAEAAAMAPRVDGVISVVRARGNSRGLLQRMRDALRQVKAEHLGVVLNAVRAQGGGYYGRNIKTYYEYQNG